MKEPKILRTYTIERSVYGDFLFISEKLSLCKSKFLENRIKDFIELNKKLLLKK